MFITNQIEFDAAADQLEAYLLIDNPTDEQYAQFQALARHMEIYVESQPTDQETMHQDYNE